MAESLILNTLNDIVAIANSFTPSGIGGITFWATFLLVFGIGYSVIGMVPALADKKKKAIRVVVSIVLAWFSATSPMVTSSVERVFPSVGVIVIGAAAFMLTVYFIFPNTKTAKDLTTYILGPIAVGAILLITWGVITQWDTPLFERNAEGIAIAGFQITHYDIALGILVVGFLVFMAWMMSTPEEEGLFDKLSKLVSRKG
jgi:hypothetical protein